MAVGGARRRQRDINKSAVLPALEEVRRVQAVRAEAADDDLDAVHHANPHCSRAGPGEGEELAELHGDPPLVEGVLDISCRKVAGPTRRSFNPRKTVRRREFTTGRRFESTVGHSPIKNESQKSVFLGDKENTYCS